MTRIAYVDGRYLPLALATVPVEDRGFQFADSVYEVAKCVAGRLVDLDRHLDRLERSLDAIALAPPMRRGALRAVLDEVLRRNRLADALVYLQVTRGTAPRQHLFPERAKPRLIVTVRPLRLPSARERDEGVAVVTRLDQRWARCDIKSTGLLANVLAKQDAARHGAREAWLVDRDGMVTEGSSTNAWIVTADGTLLTHPLAPGILGGVTRAVVLELAQALAMPVAERAYAAAELDRAREAFLTSTTSLVLPVTRIDGRAVGDGRPGPVTRALMAAYDRHVRGG
mgnify:CR=1 FL=1